MVAKYRTKIIGFRVNAEELEKLDTLSKAYKMDHANFIRAVVMGYDLPKVTVVPEINRKAWLDLSKAAGNLNQIAAWLNSGYRPHISSIRQVLDNFRISLVKAKSLLENSDEAEDYGD
jgi:hypothetical protein